MHPFLESHPSYSLAKKYFQYAPSCLYFHSSMKEEEISPKKFELIKWETSFGDSYCKICTYWTFGISTKYDSDPKIKYQNGIWFRLSCGFNVDSSEIEKIKKEIDLFLE